MFIAIHDDEDGNVSVGKGSTLKSAFDNCKDDERSKYNTDNFKQEDVLFFEGEAIQVEFHIVRKEVVQNVKAVKPLK